MKCLVLSSGGVDSTTCLSIAIEKYGKDNVSTVSVYYGQKHDKELKCAEKIADHYGVKHYTLNLEEIFKHSDCSLLKASDKEISHETYADQLEHEGRVSTYVPFRNGLILSACASLAMSIYPDDAVELYIGAHGDDAAGNAYADCSVEFINAIDTAIWTGTYGQVSIKAPFAGKKKAEVVAEGIRLKTPYALTWSCYEGGEKPCGVCGTCRDRIKAFHMNGIDDPTL